MKREIEYLPVDFLNKKINEIEQLMPNHRWNQPSYRGELFQKLFKIVMKESEIIEKEDAARCQNLSSAIAWKWFNYLEARGGFNGHCECCSKSCEMTYYTGLHRIALDCFQKAKQETERIMKRNK